MSVLTKRYGYRSLVFNLLGSFRFIHIHTYSRYLANEAID